MPGARTRHQADAGAFLVIIVTHEIAKVFVYGVAEAVKVRTGEHGYDAVQSIDMM